MGGLTLLKMSRMPEAAKELRPVVEKGDAGDQTLYGYSVALTFSGEPDKAIPMLKKVAKLKGTSEISDDAHCLLYKIYTDAGKQKEAKKHYDQAQAMSTDSQFCMM